MTIHEPATFATDCLLAILAAILAVRLRPPPFSDSSSRLWLTRAFGLLALSAFVGGAYHGFAPEIPAPYARAWWRLTLLLLHLVSAALGLSLLYTIARPSTRRFWRMVIFLKLLSFVVFAAIHPRFVVAIADYGSTLLAWFAAALILRPRWGSWIILAVALSILGALIQQLKWAPSPAFNHNDLYHVVQGLALLALFQAGQRLEAQS